MKLYLSGPIKLDRAGAPERFRAAAAVVNARGHYVVNPLDCAPLCVCPEGANLDPDAPDSKHYDCFMRGDIVAMMGCNGIVMLPRWRESSGARVEHNLALSLHFAVFDLAEFT